IGKIRRLCYSVHEAMRPTDTTDAVQDEIVVVPNFRARKQQAVREIIWEAAIDLFEQKGYDETTVDEVAQAAGISQRSFFRYFATKGDLMALCAGDLRGSAHCSDRRLPQQLFPRRGLPGNAGSCRTGSRNASSHTKDLRNFEEQCGGGSRRDVTSL